MVKTYQYKRVSYYEAEQALIKIKKRFGYDLFIMANLYELFPDYSAYRLKAILKKMSLRGKIIDTGKKEYKGHTVKTYCLSKTVK